MAPSDLQSFPVALRRPRWRRPPRPLSAFQFPTAGAEEIGGTPAQLKTRLPFAAKLLEQTLNASI